MPAFKETCTTAVNWKPVYTQLYFFDTENDMRKMSLGRENNALNANILLDLQRAVHMQNPYVKQGSLQSVILL